MRERWNVCFDVLFVQFIGRLPVMLYFFGRIFTAASSCFSESRANNFLKKNVFVFFLFRELDGLFLDYCRQRVCEDTMDKLFNLAEVRSLKLVDHEILTVCKLLVVSCI